MAARGLREMATRVLGLPAEGKLELLVEGRRGLPAEARTA